MSQTGYAMNEGPKEAFAPQKIQPYSRCAACTAANEHTSQDGHTHSSKAPGWQAAIMRVGVLAQGAELHWCMTHTNTKNHVALLGVPLFRQGAQWSPHCA